MATKATTQVTLIGCTGLVGSSASEAAVPTVRPATIHNHVILKNLLDATNSPIVAKHGVFVTALGTTRRKAGGVEKQRAIDVDLNAALVRKAKEDGAAMVILVSSVGSDPKASGAYPKMKGELEEIVKGLQFDKPIILRPGFLLGDRPGIFMGESFGQQLFYGLRKIGMPVRGICIDADDVGAAIASIAASPPEEKVSILDNTAIAAIARRWRESQLGS